MLSFDLITRGWRCQCGVFCFQFSPGGHRETLGQPGQDFQRDRNTIRTQGFGLKWSKIGQRKKKVELGVFANHPAVHSCGVSSGRVRGVAVGFSDM